MFGGDVNRFLSAGDRDSTSYDELKNVSVDLLFAALLFREAEAAIMLDRAFPDKPFATIE